MKSILLVGDIVGSYRSQTLIEYLSNRNYEYRFVYINSKFYERKGRELSTRIKRKIGQYIPFWFYFLLVPFMDIIYYLPMNYEHISIIKWAKFLDKKIISDFYVSSYYTDLYNKKINKNDYNTGLELIKKKADLVLLNSSDSVLFLNISEFVFFNKVLDNDSKLVSKIICPLVTPFRRKAILNGLKGERDCINFSWWGKASELHGFDLIVEVVSHFNKISTTKFKFHFYEINKDRANLLVRTFEDKGLKDSIEVYYKSSFNTDLELLLVNNCDIALGSFGESEMAETVLPNKVVDAISMGIPMITRSTKAIEEFKLQESCVFVSKVQVEDIVNKIDYILSNKFDINRFQKIAIDKHLESFSPIRFNNDLNRILTI